MTAQGITGPPIPVADVTGLQATLDDLQAQIDAIPGGGGGGTPITITVGRIVSGNVTPQDTSGAVQLLTGGPTFSVAAAVGDRLEVDTNYLTERRDTAYYDLVVIVGGAAVRYQTTGTGTATVEGDPGMYPQQPAYQGHPGSWAFTVESGDRSGGNVTFGFAVKAAGVGVLFANTAFPIRYTVKNYGAAS